ncbi:MAG: DUF721 domain-containing protein [Actinobacteria bacterium]|nr:DUF721 domain-containing protein [Actinomycetota bacterium]
MPSSKGFSRRKEERSKEIFAVGDIVEGLLERREFARGVPAGRLLREWPQVVGDRLAAVSVPARLEGGTLVVRADSGPWGAQVGFLAEEIRRKANARLGREVVLRVQVVVGLKGARESSKPL